MIPLRYLIALPLLLLGFLLASPGSARSPCRYWHCHTTTAPTTTTQPTTGTAPTTTTVPVTTTSSGPPVPAPIAGLGYSLVDDEEFANLNNWTNGIWYESQPAADEYVLGGDLFLSPTRAQGYPQVTATTTRSFVQGYFEARIKWTSGDGAWPAFWLLSQANRVGQTSASMLASELDVMEMQGSTPDVTSFALHRNTGSCCGIADQVHGNGGLNMGYDTSADWHTYAALWTASTITWYIDGQQIGSGATFDSTNQPMFLLLDMWEGGWTKSVDSSTPAILTTEVDWVRVWQHA